MPRLVKGVGGQSRLCVSAVSHTLALASLCLCCLPPRPLAAADTNARLAVLFDGPGTLQLDMVSLLPTGALAVLLQVTVHLDCSAACWASRCADPAA